MNLWGLAARMTEGGSRGSQPADTKHQFSSAKGLNTPECQIDQWKLAGTGAATLSPMN